MPEPTLDPIEGRIADRLLSWAENEESPPEQLEEWLQGFGLPITGLDDEPYVWLLRSASHTPESSLVIDKLGECTRQLLLMQPDVGKPGEWPEQLLYNLLLLAANLGQRTRLADPLLEM